jgi:hypothetical protein
MLATKGMRFPIGVILVCIRWYAAADAKVQALPVRKHVFLVARLSRLDLKIVELSHGVPKTRLKLNSSLGYTVGYTQEWDVVGFSDTA